MGPMAKDASNSSNGSTLQTSQAWRQLRGAAWSLCTSFASEKEHALPLPTWRALTGPEGACPTLHAPWISHLCCHHCLDQVAQPAASQIYVFHAPPCPTPLPELPEGPFPCKDPGVRRALSPAAAHTMPQVTDYSQGSYRKTVLQHATRTKANVAYPSNTLTCIFRKTSSTTSHLINWCRKLILMHKS